MLETTVAFSDTVRAGADYDLTVADLQPDRTPTDLTGCTARFQLRRNAGAETADVDLTGEPGITITPEDGKIDIHIPASTTEDLSGVYVAHLELTWPSGRVDRLIEALLTVSGEVVR